MKRIALMIISAIILSCPLYSVNSAESVSFTVDSVETGINKITEVGVNCSDTADLGAAVFDFDYDRSALEFRGAESRGAVRCCDGEKLRVVYFCDEESDFDSEIFKLKFKTVSEGNYSVNYSISECSAKSGNNLSVGSSLSGSVGAFANGEKSGKNSSSESGKRSGDGLSAKSKPLGVANDDYGDFIDDGDDPALNQKGDLNDVPESFRFPYFILLIIIAALVLIAVVTLLTVRRIIKKKKSAAENKS